VYAEARRQARGAEALPPAGYFSLKNHKLIATDAAAYFARPAAAGPTMPQTWARTQNTLQAIARTFATGRVPVAGVQATADAGYLQLLGVEKDRLAEHVELPEESTCKYCQFGAVCGRSWEKAW
jgi:hypothetical protein